MNALVKKEIRLLLPAWGTAMLLAAVPPWFASEYPPDGVITFAGLFAWGGAIILTVSSFGQEFSLGTFSLLLVQPLKRRRLWIVKTSVLAVAAAIVLVVFCLSCEMRMHAILEQHENRGDWIPTVWGMFLGGALCTPSSL